MVAVPSLNLNHPLVIRSQYGDDSIALTQWVFEQGFRSVQVVYVDTGFSASTLAWKKRVELGEAHVRQCGYTSVVIPAQISFQDAVRGRREFPSAKFQWCSALLKGLPFLDWLDTWDLNCEAIILIAKRNSARSFSCSKTLVKEEELEWIEQCEFHNQRSVWHPLIHHTKADRDALLVRAGFEPLNHRSLECQPCVNSSYEDLAKLDAKDIEKVEVLEKDLGVTLFDFKELEKNNDLEKNGGLMENTKDLQTMENNKDSQVTEIHQLQKPLGIRVIVDQVRAQGIKEQNNSNSNSNNKNNYYDLFYRGCGNHWGCGL